MARYVGKLVLAWNRHLDGQWDGKVETMHPLQAMLQTAFRTYRFSWTARCRCFKSVFRHLWCGRAVTPTTRVRRWRIAEWPLDIGVSCEISRVSSLTNKQSRTNSGSSIRTRGVDVGLRWHLPLNTCKSYDGAVTWRVWAAINKACLHPSSGFEQSPQRLFWRRIQPGNLDNCKTGGRGHHSRGI